MNHSRNNNEHQFFGPSFGHGFKTLRLSMFRLPRRLFTSNLHLLQIFLNFHHHLLLQLLMNSPQTTPHLQRNLVWALHALATVNHSPCFELSIQQRWSEVAWSMIPQWQKLHDTCLRTAVKGEVVE
ncbi:hypothetical protein LWI29_025535 [Acer saccharum]|uniref:Uncharacterized protein n=1 Tax=Acer saccharum TaxID=4024 RepID=A0AA39SDA6_ACESA|nr:hypothetical protein LWI29_025535 [Acer saccharum]